MQEKEVGDGTNFVLIFGGQLLQNAAELLSMVGSFKTKYLIRIVYINVFKI